MSSKLYVEGGGTSVDDIKCRKAFSKLLSRAGFSGRLPGITACGGRNDTFKDFKLAHRQKKPKDYVAMLVDSEDPVADNDKPWNHLNLRDNWIQPLGATDEQVLLMTTCMETWIVADRPTLRAHYRHKLQESSLPLLCNLEKLDRLAVQNDLTRATRNCSNAYAKGGRSFEIVAKLDPAELREHLRSFERAERILNKRLK